MIIYPCVCLYRNKMQSISECFSEYNRRWKKIEEMTGLLICTRPNTPTHTYSLTRTPSSSHTPSPQPQINYSPQSSLTGESLLTRRNSLNTQHSISMPVSHSLPYMRLVSDSSLSSVTDSLFHSRNSSLSSKPSQESDMDSPLPVVPPTRPSVRPSLNRTASVPVLTRKESYTEAVDSTTDLMPGDNDGSIVFTVVEKTQSLNNGQQSKKPEVKNGRRMSVQNLEPIREEDRYGSTTSVGKTHLTRRSSRAASASGTMFNNHTLKSSEV